MATIEEEIKELVRDITSVGFMAKSEARERLRSALTRQRQEGFKEGVKSAWGELPDGMSINEFKSSLRKKLEERKNNE